MEADATDYAELLQTPPVHRARSEPRVPLAATLACALLLLLLLLLHAAGAPALALTHDAVSFGLRKSAAPTPPAGADDNFGLPASVVIVGETTLDHARQRLRAALRTNSGPNCRGQFSPHRFAFLFLPGSYELDLEVGFYMQVAGLGRTPEQVTFNNRAGRGLGCRRRVRVRPRATTEGLRTSGPAFQRACPVATSPLWEMPLSKALLAASPLSQPLIVAARSVHNCGPEPPGPPHQGKPYADVGALDNFWRSTENLRINGTLVWAASQAAPLRSVVADDVTFSDGGGWSSGGFAT